MPILYLIPIPVSQCVLNTEDMVLFPLNCLKDHWIPWINLIKKWRKKRKKRRGMEEKKGRREEEKEFSMSSNIYGFTVT